jgi:dienelactone hydrolase
MSKILTILTLSFFSTCFLAHKKGGTERSEVANQSSPSKLASTPFPFEKVTAGASPVGFQTLFLYDPDRPALAEQPELAKGRFLPVNIWYPATAGKTEKLTYRDYTAQIFKELDEAGKAPFADSVAGRFDVWHGLKGEVKTAFDAFLATMQPMLAVQNAKPAKGKFPVALLVHGFLADNAFMGEYLASHGYIALHVPTKGTAHWDLDFAKRGLETQISDYEFALRKAKEHFPKMVGDAVAAVGMSFGGQSALGLALRNPAIKAVVSLDGGIGSQWGGSLLAGQPFYSASKVNLPILHLYNARDPYTDLSWFDQWQSSARYLIAMKNMEHGHFGAFGQLGGYVPGLLKNDPVQPGSGYEAVLSLTQRFLDAQLKSGQKITAENLLPEGSWERDCVDKIVFK